MATEDPKVEDGERPTANQIATRIDLGCASYHELCCPFAIDASGEGDDRYGPVSCDCGGEAMAGEYVMFWRALERIADGDIPGGLSAGGFAEAVLRQEMTVAEKGDTR